MTDNMKTYFTIENYYDAGNFAEVHQIAALELMLEDQEEIQKEIQEEIQSLLDILNA